MKKAKKENASAYETQLGNYGKDVYAHAGKYDGAIAAQVKDAGRDNTELLRNRNNADIAQAIAKTSLRDAQANGRTKTIVGDHHRLVGAANKAMGQATLSGKKLNASKIGNLSNSMLQGTANAQTGLASVARHKASEVAAITAADQAEHNNRIQQGWEAVGSIAGAKIKQKNKEQKVTESLDDIFDSGGGLF